MSRPVVNIAHEPVDWEITNKSKKGFYVTKQRISKLDIKETNVIVHLARNKS